MTNPLYASCVSACESCVQACRECVTQLRGTALFGSLEHAVELCQSSMRICSIAAEELQLDSAFFPQVCALSSVICRACADECRRQAGEAWQQCADACWRAAEACHSVAKAKA